ARVRNGALRRPPSSPYPRCPDWTAGRRIRALRGLSPRGGTTSGFSYVSIVNLERERTMAKASVVICPSCGYKNQQPLARNRCVSCGVHIEEFVPTPGL